MSEVIIRAERLTKVYRLYSKPYYRFLDMFGLLRGREGVFSEHSAVSGVDITIRRGEKVAFIGRNGAGKSTLLKLFTRVTEPSSGLLDIQGNVQALLQIGSGFHPEFTGRENVFSYLAQLGVTGDEAERRFDEIVEFAELEEYIDQPVKTYSSGMSVRLMFATSTSVTPEVLVLDEVLSVGDAYFAHKSFSRIQEMSDQQGTTVLLVSHDVYSAAKLCSRMVWIDQGRVLIDGESKHVIRAYENSVRVQEESRLRKRLRDRLAEGTGESARLQRSKAQGAWLIELRSPTNQPQRGVIYFRRIEVLVDDEIKGFLPLVTEPEFPAGLVPGVLMEEGCWGKVIEHLGVSATPMLNYGSSFHKVSGAVGLGALDAHDAAGRLELRIEYAAPDDSDLEVVLIAPDGSATVLGTLSGAALDWSEMRFPLPGGSDDQGAAKDASALLNLAGNRHGSSRVRIVDVRLFDAEHHLTARFEHGKAAMVEIRFDIPDPTVSEDCDLLLAFVRNGVEDVCRMTTRSLRFDASRRSSGAVYLYLDGFPLGPGKYEITFMIAAEGYYERKPKTFYSVNPEVYDCHNKLVEFEVTALETDAGRGTGLLLDRDLKAHWLMCDVLEDQHLPGVGLLARASQRFAPRPIGYFPGWYMGVEESGGDPVVIERKAIFEAMRVLAFNEPMLCSWVEGLSLRLRLEGDIARALFVGGSYEPNEFAFVREFVKPGMTVVDVGANIGLYTTYLAHLTGAGGRVFAFEPSEREFIELRENLAVNGLDHVTVLTHGLHDQEAELDFFIASDELRGHNTFDRLVYFNPVPVLRLRIGSAEPQWLTAWNGTRTFDVVAGDEIELYVYSESDFDYVLNGVSVGVGKEDGPLFADWGVERSAALHYDAAYDGVRLAGAKGDFLRLTYVVPADATGSLTIKGSAIPASALQTAQVTVRPLDIVLAELGVQQVDFVKIDVEGSEPAVLRGATEMLRRDRPLMLLEVDLRDRPDVSRATLDLLTSIGYRTFGFSTICGRIFRTDTFEPRGQNIVAVPEERLDEVRGIALDFD